MQAANQRSEIPRINILGSHYSRLTRESVNAWVIERALAGSGGYVCVSNVHTTMMGRADPAYQKITNESALSIPDGMPLVWGMKLLGAPEQDRVRGPTLMKEICDQGRKNNLKHYLLGGSPETLVLLEKVLLEKYPGIQIVGKESPPYRAATQMEKEMRMKMVWLGY
jgi:N-acetylglucosaminyldiphosphoundecaprenol N-acetyl-beta-D-mannosaminyltransferase